MLGNDFYNELIPGSAISVLLFTALLSIHFNNVSHLQELFVVLRLFLFRDGFFFYFSTVVSSQISLGILIRVVVVFSVLFSALASVRAQSTHILRDFSSALAAGVWAVNVLWGWVSQGQLSRKKTS